MKAWTFAELKRATSFARCSSWPNPLIRHIYDGCPNLISRTPGGPAPYWTPNCWIGSRQSFGTRGIKGHRCGQRVYSAILAAPTSRDYFGQYLATILEPFPTRTDTQARTSKTKR